MEGGLAVLWRGYNHAGKMFANGLEDAAAIVATAIAVVALALWLAERLRLRKLRERHAALSASAALLEQAVAQAIVTVNAGGLIRSLNPAAQLLFGYAIDEVLGQNVLQFVAFNDAARENTRAREGDSYELPAEVRRMDQTLIPVQLHVTPLRTQTEPRIRFLIEDLSGHHKQAQLEAENSLLWPTFDEAGLVIAVVDASGAIVRLSHSGVNLLKVSDAEVEGRIYWEVFESEANWDASRETFERAKRNLGPTRITPRWLSPDSAPIALDWVTLSPSWDDRGEVAHVVVTAALATASRQKMLQITERIAGRIAGHFENLLSTINGYSELVLHDLKPSSPLRKDMEQILAASERASETVRQLLGFSGCRLLLPERVDLSALLPGAAPAAVLGSRKALEEMIKVLSESAAAALQCEPARLTQARAMAVGEIPAGDYVKLSVPLGDVREEEVFDRFLDPVGSPLSLVHGIARSCSGGVSIAHSGSGSVTLEVWLPAATPEAAEFEASPAPARAAVTR